jgi:hypothetical protein
MLSFIKRGQLEINHSKHKKGGAMVDNSEMSCDEYANILRTVAGWTFCKMFHDLFGNNLLLLEKEGDHGEDVRFLVTKKWLKLNNASRFGLTSDASGIQFVSKLTGHVRNCQTPCCIEAMKISREISALAGKGQFPGSEVLCLIKAFFEKVCGPDSNYVMVLSREKGAGSSVDEIKPFIQWFTGENKDFWIWPEEEKFSLTSLGGKSN